MLKKPTKLDQLRLGQSIWSWDLCAGCLNESQCERHGCDSDRAENLTRYWAYYTNAILDYNSMTEKHSDLPVGSHVTTCRIVRVLQEQPGLTREDLAQRAGVKPNEVDLGVKLMTMISCSYETGSFIKMEQGTNPIPWGPATSLDHFVELVLPVTDKVAKLGAEQRSALMARKLRKKIKFHIRPTSDLREHLRMDRGRRAVLVFHHTAFLKEHLRRTKVLPRDASVHDCLRL